MASDYLPNLVPALPELFLVCTVLALLMFGLFQKGGDEDTNTSVSRTISMLSIVSLVLTMLLVAMVSGSRTVIFSNMFVTDNNVVYLKFLLLIGSILTILLSQAFLERHGTARFEYAIFIIFATLGMMLMLSANDLLGLYVGIEMQSLSLYVIASFHKDDKRSAEAGLKYFVLGAVASGLLLYGSSLVYGFSGTTNFEKLHELFVISKPGNGVIIGMVFILAGLAFKVSAVPFHMWTPDVYEGAPTPVTAFFAVSAKIAAVGIFLRIMMGPFSALVINWQGIIILISICSMILGSIAAINQQNIKRLMAYSSIGHIGYALIGLAAANLTGIRGVLTYLAIYLVMNIGAFACILCIRKGGKMLENINDFSGLAKTHPFLATATATFMFSLAGIPPLAGFFGKFYIFLGAIEAELYMLAIIGVLTSVIGAFYYLRIIKIMYFSEPIEQLDLPFDTELRGIILITGLLVALFFIYPTPLISAAETAANALLTF